MNIFFQAHSNVGKVQNPGSLWCVAHEPESRVPSLADTCAVSVSSRISHFDGHRLVLDKATEETTKATAAAGLAVFFLLLTRDIFLSSRGTRIVWGVRGGLHVGLNYNLHQRTRLRTKWKSQRRFKIPSHVGFTSPFHVLNIPLKTQRPLY